MDNHITQENIPENIQLKPIEGEQCRSCPSCQEPLLRVKVADQRHPAGWLFKAVNSGS